MWIRSAPRTLGLGDLFQAGETTRENGGGELDRVNRHVVSLSLR
jgi:hypothetical protein